MTPMIYDLAVVDDRGAYWYVKNVFKNTIDPFADSEDKILRLSFSAYNIISTALQAGKTVKIPKVLKTNEVLPGEVEVIDLGTDDPLKEAKNAATIRARMVVTPELAKISSLTIYGFTVLNNDLANAGYFITNENREEKYLQILETGDEKLITKLEDYLNYKDEIEAVAQLERKFARFRQDINNAKTVEAVKALETSFFDVFYQNF